MVDAFSLIESYRPLCALIMKLFPTAQKEMCNRMQRMNNIFFCRSKSIP